MEITTQKIIDSKIIHVFMFYDMPLIFVSQTEEGELFWHHYIGPIDDGKKDKWFIGVMSAEQLVAIKERKMGIKKVLMELLVNDKLFYAEIEHTEPVRASFEKVTEENLVQEALPTEDNFVEYDYFTKIEYN